MRYIDRQLRGTFLYITKQRRFEIIKTVILFAMAFGIFFIGLATLHTKKSLWSVFAVLALLPACKSLVGVIMFARFSSLNEAEYERFSSAAGDLTSLYENVITTKERSFFVPVICIKDGNVVALRSNDKSDNNDLAKHIESVLAAAGHKATFFIFDSEKAFIDRIRQMSQGYEGKTAREEAIATTIKAVSL